MNDLISRQAAIDEIRTMQTYKLFAGADMLLVDQAEAMTNLMMMPTAPQWIPVTERLPEKDGRYLICTKKFVGIDDFRNDEFVFFRSNVTAWMPLSEPYKGGEG